MVKKCINRDVAILNRKFRGMHPLEVYYLNKAGPRRSVPPTPPALPSARTRDRLFFGNLFRWDRPLLWSRAKAVGRETLRTGGKILTDIAARDEVSAGDIISKQVTESAQTLISKLKGRGRKRAEEAVGSRKKKKKKDPKPKKIKRAPRKIIKRDIFT